jgi:hypothetical protein
MRLLQQLSRQTSILHLLLSLTFEEVIMRPDQIGINNHHICSLGLSVFENDTGRSARIVVVDRSDWGRVMEVCSVGFGNLDQGIWDRVESAFWVPLFSQRLLLGAKSQRGRTIPSQVSVHCRSLINQLGITLMYQRGRLTYTFLENRKAMIRGTFIISCHHHSSLLTRAYMLPKLNARRILSVMKYFEHRP